eukprot:CAMPEP_0183304006 /NCGR_PEP_ID=MMETSP0160_2-20130417/9247_1 /TAXON_ID=2839 ORGANISM="Odontella Sinensis, Strain Grunow 1884" /NCGR_SAMPLE_ID=MMETSP0160_2 /ASSEMBLY_ACC=CAM_ASM_000250 /LENGTH=91 /DNA_ID=CAMNT_0025466991 /DNA_START=86 /DNA_END=357 /DNA_ORIENTATION=+
MEIDDPASPESAPPPAPSSSQEQPQPPSASLFDVEVYAARYDPQSETRLQRLLHVAKYAPNDEMKRIAYGMAEVQMRETGNVRRYREVFEP